MRSTRSPRLTRRSASCCAASAPQVRNAGTLGGNIANGSPIGDSMPVLIALGTSLLCSAGKATRERRAGGALHRLPEDGAAAGRVRRARSACRAAPPARASARYKLTKRFDQDISAVCAAFASSCDGECTARVALRRHGGDAERARARPRRRLPAALDARRRARALARSTATSRRSPTCAPRAGYRRTVAQNLLQRVRELARRRAARRRCLRRCEPATAASPHDSAALHVTRRGALRRRHARAARHAARGARHVRRSARAHRVASTSTAVRAAPGVVAVHHRGRHPRRERHRPGARRRAVFADGHWSSSAASRSSRSRRRASSAARRAARLAQHRLRGRCRRCSPSSTRWRRSSSCCRPRACRRAAMPRRRSRPRRTGSAARCAAAARTTSTSRARSRSRVPRGRRRCWCYSLDAAPERGAAPGRARARPSPTNAVDGRVPAHGRRLRRQGDAGGALRVRRRAARARHRPAGEAARSTATTT